MADAQLKKLLIERVVNRRDENETPASQIWQEGTGTPAAFVATRLQWLKDLGTNADNMLEGDIPDYAPAGQPHTTKHVGRGAGNVPAAVSGKIKTAIKHLSDEGILEDGYNRVRRLIGQLVKHELEHCESHLKAEIEAAYRTGYLKGFADQIAGVSAKEQSLKAYLGTVAALNPPIAPPGAGGGAAPSQHHTY